MASVSTKNRRKELIKRLESHGERAFRVADAAEAPLVRYQPRTTGKIVPARRGAGS